MVGSVSGIRDAWPGSQRRVTAPFWASLCRPGHNGFVRFRTTVELGGKTATGMPVPADVVVGLGRGRRVPVTVTLNGYTYRSTVASMGGVFLIPLSAEHREGAGVAAGDEVDVDVEVDDQPRDVEVPADLQAALDADVVVRQAFDALSYSNKRRLVLAVDGAKAPETRARRIAKIFGELRPG